jgi:hypothetical protein
MDRTDNRSVLRQWQRLYWRAFAASVRMLGAHRAPLLQPFLESYDRLTRCAVVARAARRTFLPQASGAPLRAGRRLVRTGVQEIFLPTSRARVPSSCARSAGGVRTRPSSSCAPQSDQFDATQKCTRTPIAARRSGLLQSVLHRSISYRSSGLIRSLSLSSASVRRVVTINYWHLTTNTRCSEWMG